MSWKGAGGGHAMSLLPSAPPKWDWCGVGLGCAPPAQQLQQLVFPSLRPNSGFPGGQCVPALPTATGCVLITLKNMEMCKWVFISLLLIKCLQCCLGRSGLFDTARLLVFLEQPSVQSAVKNWFVTAQSHFSSWIKLKKKIKIRHTSILHLKQRNCNLKN